MKTAKNINDCLLIKADYQQFYLFILQLQYLKEFFPKYKFI